MAFLLGSLEVVWEQVKVVEFVIWVKREDLIYLGCFVLICLIEFGHYQVKMDSKNFLYPKYCRICDSDASLWLCCIFASYIHWQTVISNT